MTRNCSIPMLPGDGANDYARYMRTDELLSLQRTPQEWVHRDELLFQTVHQTTELWLKMACAEVATATDRIGSGELAEAVRLLDRAAFAVELITDQLDMLRHLAPRDFQLVRTVLGHGSGFESPGWQEVRRVSTALNSAFTDLVAERGVDLVELYRGDQGVPEYRLAEAMLDWDERVAVWRARHYKIATRIIGHRVVGTKGTPVDALAKLVAHKLFPRLWEVRTHLTETGAEVGPEARAS